MKEILNSVEYQYFSLILIIFGLISFIIRKIYNRLPKINFFVSRVTEKNMGDCEKMLKQENKKWFKFLKWFNKWFN
jgi:hypothetical protein